MPTNILFTMKALPLVARSTRAALIYRPAACGSSSRSVQTRILVPSTALTGRYGLSMRNRSPFSSSHAVAAFTNSPASFKGLQPDSSEPAPPNTEPHPGSGSAAQISDAEYHEIADQYLNSLVLATEELSERNSDGLEVEFSVRRLLDRYL